MSIRIETKVIDAIAVIEISGTLTDEAGVVDMARDALNGDVNGLVFDLSEVDMISSSGLADLVQVKAGCNSQHIAMRLASPTPFVVGVLETTKLIGFFDIYDKLSDALASISS